MSGGGGSSSDGGGDRQAAAKAAMTSQAAYSGNTNQSPAGGASAGGNYGGDSSGGYSDKERGQQQASNQNPTPTGGDYDDNVVDTYSPYAGDSKFNPTTGKMERSQDYTFSEHWNRAPDALKFSPTLRFLYASGKNVGEWANRKGFNINRSGTNTTDPNRFTPESGGDNERSMMNTLAPEAPYIVSGITPPTSSPASNWYANLGTTNTNQHSTDIATQYAAAKTAVSTTLKNKGAIGMLAVNQSPFYDWLKTNKIDKGIL